MKILLNNSVLAFCILLTGSTMSFSQMAPDTYFQCENHFLDLDENLIIDRLSCIENEVPLPYNNRVKGFIDFFIVRDRQYTTGVLNARETYFPIFEEALERHGLPNELKYLAIVESGLNPKAVSPAYAVGLWQFMNGTGRMFGLKADVLIDDRMDPFLATDAACLYLKSLYSMFNDWPLALAAYNCGPGNVRKAIRRSGYKTDFWEVYARLPQETRSYVPQFIAITYVMNYAEEHLLFPETRKYFPAYVDVKVSQNLSLKTLSRELDVCIDDLRLLNPQIKKDVIPMHRKDYTFRIPANAYENFVMRKDSILAYSEKLDQSETMLISNIDHLSPFGKEKYIHKVRSGDVLGKIAEKYQVRVSDIKRWNNLSSNTIKIGQNLVIHKTPGYAPKATQVVQNTTSKQNLPDDKVYLVKYGDTLWDISQKFEGLSIEKIKQLNNLPNNTIKPGMKLRLG